MDVAHRISNCANPILEEDAGCPGVDFIQKDLAHFRQKDKTRAFATPCDRQQHHVVLEECFEICRSASRRFGHEAVTLSVGRVNWSRVRLGSGCDSRPFFDRSADTFVPHVKSTRGALAVLFLGKDGAIKWRRRLRGHGREEQPESAPDRSIAKPNSRTCASVCNRHVSKESFHSQAR